MSFPSSVWVLCFSTWHSLQLIDVCNPLSPFGSKPSRSFVPGFDSGHTGLRLEDSPFHLGSKTLAAQRGMGHLVLFCLGFPPVNFLLGHKADLKSQFAKMNLWLWMEQFSIIFNLSSTWVFIDFWEQRLAGAALRYIQFGGSATLRQKSC